MRHEPFFIDRVTREAPPDLVIHAACRHFVACVQHHVDGILVAVAVSVAQQHQRQAGPGELGCVAEAAEAAPAEAEPEEAADAAPPAEEAPAKADDAPVAPAEDDEAGEEGS